MLDLGKESEVVITGELRPLRRGIDFSVDQNNVPTNMPVLPEGEEVVAKVNRVIDTRLVLCTDLSDMVDLQRMYHNGSFVNLDWFSAAPFTVSAVPAQRRPNDN